MGMPGFSGFIAELPIFLGAWQAGNTLSEFFIAPYYAWIAIISALAIVITAAYVLRVVQRVFFGVMPERFAHEVGDVKVLDKVAVTFLSVILILLGWFPALMAPLVQTGVADVMAILGGA